MNILGLTITRTKATPNNLQSVDNRGGWWPIIRESFAGAWQTNTEVRLADVLTYSAVYACLRLISQDISKLRVKLMEVNEDGVWTETDNPAFSPVIRKPNHYQTRIQFYAHWVLSKLINGNAYILLKRDNRRVVTGQYVLDPTRVKPLVASNGDVYYEIKKDDLSLQPDEQFIVPAGEIIHDRMSTSFYHPLMGISPISACGLAAIQGLKIQNNSANFFNNGSNPSGVLTAPGQIADATALRVKEYWETEFSGDNAGKVAVLGDGLKYEPMMMSAADSQLIEQLNWTAIDVCTAFLMPPYKISIGPQPTYSNVEALNQQYYSGTLQELIESIELLQDQALGLAVEGKKQQFGVEFDLDALLRMDTATRVKAAQDSIAAGMKINEVRRIYHDLGPVTGGDTVYLQQQNFSLEALAKRDASPDPFGTAKPTAPPPEPTTPPGTPDKTALARVVKAYTETLAA